MTKIKQQFIHNLDKLLLNGFTWELLNSSHTNYIVKWRNDPSNLIFFDSQKKITPQDQEVFLSNSVHLDRVDIILLQDQEPIGVFNIKNISTKPEYGALLGKESMRGKGIGYAAKMSIFDYWFNTLNQNCIYVKNKKINEKVVASNLKLGFIIAEEDECFLELKLWKKNFIKIKKGM